MAGVTSEMLGAMRVTVGYLGEREQHAWWTSAFFTASSRAFLEPVFPRTMLLAQCTGVAAAAAITHDDRIGIGDVFHLFRLPEDLEQAIHAVLQVPEVAARIAPLATTEGAALAFLRQHAGDPAQHRDGPVRVGGTLDLRRPGAWRQAAALYLGAFEAGAQVFPFFADRESGTAARARA